MKYGDNRDCMVRVGERMKHRPYVKAAAAVFNKWFPKKKIKVVDIGTRDGYAVQRLKEYGYGTISWKASLRTMPFTWPFADTS
jgi:hypothetical protein